MRSSKGETIQFSVRLPISLREEINSSAKELDIDVATWIRHACRDKLEKHKKESESTQGTPINDAAIASAVEKYLSHNYTFNKVSEKGAEKIMQRI